MSDFEIGHDDHDKTEEQTSWLVRQIKAEREVGFFIHTAQLPPRLGTLENALYGPTCGDMPVMDVDCTFEKRGNRPWSDKLVARPKRQSNVITGIGVLNEDGSVKFFTVHGGPPAAQNPADPGCVDVPAAKKFWNTHALAI